ncbi:UbiA prenyltransferase family protein [Saccharothrix deserti]|uniref:UbiA prenyltransferase family protein n=1 Tax=Saccharothrix deserti TaxID=2593674 RepID=UPI00131B3A10|nr:UbiA prenyltransferase family protein [Saccharothrix deserti]
MKRLSSEDTVGGAAAVPEPRAAVPLPAKPAPDPIRRPRLPAALVLLRPRQWVKNIFVLIVPLAVDPVALWHNMALALATTATFTAASAAVYVLNDWLDREKDRLHPVKRHRPLASGRVGPRGALLLGAGCLAVLAAGGALLPPGVQAAVAGYAVLNLAYCLALKHYPLVDVSAVAAGFVLRAVAGCLAVAAPFNPALILCVYFTCLLMSLGKRRYELSHLREQADAQRPALTGYSVPLLDQLVAVLLAATLVSYEMFVLSGPHPQAAVLAVVTVPFVVFALCRYAYLLAAHRGGGEPGRDVLTDVPLIVNAVLWLACLAVGRLL